ncbi:hypothetical protein [Roseateles aquatilis]|uniref:hypothetical protein n=1 Tax=Roseateles aquatilis TaxID=431061 RepID=UPI001875B11F|nr:hypothetical protein [Roseateles aquatilis]
MEQQANVGATGNLTAEQLEALELDSGSHPGPDAGHCLLEVVSLFAGEDFGDSPACVDPILAEFGRSWNDGMRSNEERAQLKRYIPLLPGTNQGAELSQLRGWMAADWLIRVCTPAWLDLSPSMAEHAAALRALAPIHGEQALAAAVPTLDKARSAAAAARAAARDAARAAARDAARAAARDAARAAARDAARDAAWDAARDAAWDAARDAAWDAAWAAAWDAAWAAAWAAALSAPTYGEARAAADKALAPTCEQLQLSAHELFLAMINAELRAESAQVPSNGEAQ